MSGIYIEGLEMPKSCYKCPMKRRNGMDIVCPVAHERFSVADVNILDYRLDNCPLIPVPPHGRLIDADALTDAIDSTDWYHQAPNKDMVHGANSAEHQAWYKEQDIYSAIDNAPTIISEERRDK